MKKSKQETQIEAVKAIISGELLMEEAMVKYNVKDKRTMSAWIRKTIPFLKVSAPISNGGTETLFDTRSDISTLHSANQAVFHQDILKENALLKKVIDLQDKVRELEGVNSQLARHRNLLLEKVTALELKIQVRQKGDK